MLYCSLSVCNIFKTCIYIFVSRDLKINRVKALQQLQDPRNAIEGVEKAITEYLSLFWGLIEDVAVPGKDGEKSSVSGEAKLQKIETFKWTHSICGNTAMYALCTNSKTTMIVVLVYNI